MGHTTIGEPFPDDQVYAETRRFFDGLQLSGPVSLELKRDPDGVLWVIEPTIGRTDFWIGLCVANGVNLPLVEYCHQTGLPIPRIGQNDASVWFNEDRDPMGRLWVAAPSRRYMKDRAASYVFLHGDDPGPMLAFARRAASSRAGVLGRRLKRLLPGDQET
jgi:predicted ATP-grasp superfamily ATP-dependent carboligase